MEGSLLLRRSKNRIALLILLFDLRLKKEMRVVRRLRHTQHVQLILPVFMRVENAAAHRDVAFRRGELTAFGGGKRHHVLRPGTLEVREVSAGIFGFGDSGRSGCRPRGRGRKHAAQRVLPREGVHPATLQTAHVPREVVRVFRGGLKHISSRSFSPVYRRWGGKYRSQKLEMAPVKSG